MKSSRLLQGKRVLITGGSRGLGSELVQVFSSHGARVAFTFHSNERQARQTSELLETRGCAPLSFKCSVLDPLALNKVKETLEAQWQGLDILVNNAGVTQALPLALMDESDWDQVMDTNTKGIYLTTKSFLPLMIRQRAGSILNIGSLAGERLLSAPVHYCTSKAAVGGFTASLSKEVARYKIRVNCIAPGLLEDGVAKNIPENKIEDFKRNVSLRRCGTLREVAQMASFLVSDQNSFMTGATVLIDGGF